jgi:hypothetical protein
MWKEASLSEFQETTLLEFVWEDWKKISYGSRFLAQNL